MYPQLLQSTCHYTVNRYVKIWRLGGANNMHSLRWGILYFCAPPHATSNVPGRGAQTKNPKSSSEEKDSLIKVSKV